MGEYITCYENNRFSYKGYHDPDYANDTDYLAAGGEGDVCDHDDPIHNETRDTCYFQVQLGQETEEPLPNGTQPTWTYKCMHHNECPVKDPVTGEGIMGCYNVTNTQNPRITCCCQEDFCNGPQYVGYALLGYAANWSPQIPLELDDYYTPRIINGRRLNAEQYPYIASLRMEIDYDLNGQLTTFTNSFCGGIMYQLSPPIIISSAHCFDAFIYNETDDTLSIDIGGELYEVYLFVDLQRTYPEGDISGDTYYTLPILDYSQIINQHELYVSNGISSIHDMTLLIFNDYNITQFDITIDALPVLVSNMDEIDVSSEVFTVIGYGASTEDGSGANRLQLTELEYIDAETCVLAAIEYFGIFANITNITAEQVEVIKENLFSSYYAGEVICARAIENGTDICYGDSSGPLLRFGEDNVAEIVGIATADIGECNDGEHINIYSSIPYYYDWISKTVDYVVYNVTWSPTIQPTTSTPTTSVPSYYESTAEGTEDVYLNSTVESTEYDEDLNTTIYSSEVTMESTESLSWFEKLQENQSWFIGAIVILVVVVICVIITCYFSYRVCTGQSRKGSDGRGRYEVGADEREDSFM